jgi:hypothetical protein
VGRICFGFIGGIVGAFHFVTKFIDLLFTLQGGKKKENKK